MGLKNLVKKWLEIDEPPRTQIPRDTSWDHPETVARNALDAAREEDAMVLINAGLVGTINPVSPPTVHERHIKNIKRRHAGEHAKVVDPNDVNALLGSLNP